VIHYLKSHTGVYCPVETTPYGGPQAPREWFEHFRWIGDAGDVRCWPGGHASSGFTLLALYFVALRHGWTHARRLLVTLLMLGLAYAPPGYCRAGTTCPIPSGQGFSSG